MIDPFVIAKNSRFILVVPLCCLFYGRISATSDWMVKAPFEHKVFVKNNGQFNVTDERGGNIGEVMFAARSGSVEYFFSPKGLCYRYNEQVYEKDREGGKKKDGKVNSTKVPRLLQMEWSDPSPSCRLIAVDTVSWYFTYGDQRDKSGNTAIKAPAFKKIIYKDLYPGIDVEYILPADSGGLKYTISVHPGADPSRVRMLYKDSKELQISGKGDVLIQSVFGFFTDHAPVSFYEGDRNRVITSSFSIAGQSVSFNIGAFDQTKTLIIDPWTVNPPAFTGARKAAYDVEYDLQGNVYAYGSNQPFEVIKYNAAGVQQWIYQTIFVTDFYGDFAVDGASGSAYIVEGYRQGAAQIIKINSAGTQLGIYPGTASMDEMWRVTYNNCTKKAVVAGGGVSGNCQAGVLDTTLATFTPVNVLGAGTPLHDFSLLAIDNTSQCYMATSKSFAHPALYDNRMVKCPAATLSPNAYMVPTNHQFLELASINYTNTPWQTNGINGFNGMAVSGTSVYTYDGQTVKRWNKNTGAFIGNATLTATPFICGGIAVTDCDELFIGVEKSVIRYDANFNVLATVIFPDTVYDVRLGMGTDIYACGKNFVAAFTVPGTLVPCNSLSITITPSGNCNSGNVSASVAGGNPGYNYSWQPGGQSTSAVTALPPGSYTLTVSDNSCIQKFAQTVVTVSAGSFSVTAASTPASCLNNDGSASVNVVIGTSPYTYQWSPSGGTNVTASGLSAGTYSVLVSDASGCTTVSTVSITIPNAPTFSLSVQNIICNGGPGGSASTAVSGGTAPYTYVWSATGSTTASVSGLTQGNYSATITDANGCSSTQTFSITQPPALVLTVTTTPAACSVSNGSAGSSVSGGTGTYTYVWSPQGGNAATVSGIPSGSYSLTVTDASGCTTIAVVAVGMTGGATGSIVSQSAVSCNGGSNATALISATGGTTPYTYSWSPAGGNSASASGLSAGSYTCYITDAAGCTSSVPVTIGQPSALALVATATPTPCGLSNGTAAVSASGGTAAYTYNWLPSGGNAASANGLSGGSYTVVVTDANGCTSVASAVVSVLNGPTANAGANVNIVIGDSTTLSGSGGVAYQWTPAASLSCITCQNPVASPTVTTTYTLIVTDANGCTDVAVVTVLVEPLSCENRPHAGKFMLPNAFSPNGDGENDDYCLAGGDECIKEFEIRIFNRWGEPVFEDDDRFFCWEGDHNGVPLNPGVYAYLAKVVLYNGEKKNLKGNISLIR